MHDQITDRLSEYLDDELASTERAAVDAHLAGCAECRAVLGDLRSIVAAAGRLPGSMPDRELWAGVTDRIGAKDGVLPLAPRSRKRFSFTAPQLAAAGIILMLLSGGLVYMLRPQTKPVATVTDAAPPATPVVAPASLVDPQYEDAAADLEQILAQGRGRLDPQTVRVLEQNLQTIDAAIAQSRRALEADPANAFLNSHLESARQRKLALLRRATALTIGS